MSIKKVIFIVVIAALLIGSGIGYNFYSKIFSSNIKEETSIYIPTQASFDEVLTVISPHIKNENSFKWVAQKKNYPNKIKAGHYILKKGMNNNELIDLLRSGEQVPITVSFNNQDSVEKLAGRVAMQIEPDSLALVTAIFDPSFLKKHHLNKADVLKIFIPNSYELYWNTSPEKFRDRMLREYDRFWTETRKAKAKKLGLTPNEVVTLASIVQKETTQPSERPVVAGLYLNRLRDGWPLQADPTIIFALKQKYGQNTVIKRVLNKDLSINSPYNTYKHSGLPPALIAMPDISSIDAVLNRDNHNYYYMCASVEKLGFHEFARTLEQHNLNASKYQRWLSKQGINR